VAADGFEMVVELGLGNLNLGVDGVERVAHFVTDGGVHVGHVLALGVHAVHHDLLRDVDQLDGELRFLPGSYLSKWEDLDEEEVKGCFGIKTSFLLLIDQPLEFVHVSKARVLFFESEDIVVTKLLPPFNNFVDGVARGSCFNGSI